MSGFVGPFPPLPKHFQQMMIFIDGTNVLNRLSAHKLIVPKLLTIVQHFSGGRQIMRTYLYTVEQNYNKALEVHGNEIFDGIRIVFGDGIQKADGNVKEKGVDALLVADLVYHAASKNINYALVVSSDTDFVHALKRVEDFGCRTGVLGICDEVPDRLKKSADEIYFAPINLLIERKWVKTA